MADAIVEIADLRKTYGGVEALAGLNLACRGARFADCSVVTARARRRRSRRCSAWFARRAARSGRSVSRPTSPEASVEIRAPDVVRERGQRSLYVDVRGGDRRVRGRSLSALARGSQRRYLRKLELPADRSEAPVARHAHEARVAARARRGRGARDPRRADRGPRSGATEELLQLLVGHVAREGVTALLSSHQLVDIEQVADHVAIVDRGRTLLDAPLDDLRASYRRVQVVFAGDAPQIDVCVARSRRRAPGGPRAHGVRARGRRWRRGRG